LMYTSDCNGEHYCTGLSVSGACLNVIVVGDASVHFTLHFAL